MRIRIFVTALVFALMAIAGTASAQFVEKKTVSLALAKKMAAASEAEATKNNWAMVITVVDDGGNIVYIGRMDGAPLGSIDVSQGKAHTALAFRRPSKAFQDLVDQNQAHLVTLPHVTAVQGGLPIMLDGKVVGAIGVSGGTSAQDEQCAQAGINAIGEK